MIQKLDRTGEVSYTKYGTKAVIVNYINYKKVLVEFQDEHKYRYYTSYGNFLRGQLTNPYERRHKNSIGFIGVGDYNSKEHRLAYLKWAAIIQRCIKTDYKNNNDKSIASYQDCKVCNEWLNFQNFAEWFYKEIYECENEPLCVDKDILVHGNKLYSPETCLLVPQRINLLFVKEKGRRGKYLIGAQKGINKNKFISIMSTLNGNVYLGTFESEKDAFEVYKKEKEKYIKEVAELYKNKIPEKVYNAMLNYKIEITD